MSQSTNDTIPTAIRLGCLWRLDELSTACSDLTRCAARQSIEFDRHRKIRAHPPARCGSSAPGPGIWRLCSRGGTRCRADRRAAEGLRRLGIGGTATGTGLNAHPEYHHGWSKQLSRAVRHRACTSSDNLFETMQSMADMADFSASLRTLAVTLIAHRQRFPTAGLWAFHRAGRNPSAGRPARFQHHAGKSQPGAGRNAGYGHVPCSGLRSRLSPWPPRPASWS